MAELLDRCKFTSGSSGTGSFADGPAIQGFRNLSGAGAANLIVYPYSAENATKTEWEDGHGVYNSATGTLSRAPSSSSNGNAVVNFTTNPTVMITPLRDDLKQAASDTVAGLIEIADQTEMEAGSDTARAVSPGRQQFHPSACKAWCFVNVAAGVPTLQASYNITSITDAGAGNLGVTIGTDFSSSNWSPCISSQVPDFNSCVSFGNVAPGSVNIFHGTPGGGFSDPIQWSFHGFGDQ